MQQKKIKKMVEICIFLPNKNEFENVFFNRVLIFYMFQTRLKLSTISRQL